MALGVYKMGQGYWTRLMSAIGGGALALAGAAWVYGQLAQAKWFGIQESVYIQGAGAALVFLIAGGFVYYFVGINKHTSEFLIATEGEMRKVHWSTKREIYGSTVVVILVSLVIALLLFVGDYAFAALFRAVGVLQG